MSILIVGGHLNLSILGTKRLADLCCLEIMKDGDNVMFMPATREVGKSFKVAVPLAADPSLAVISNAVHRHETVQLVRTDRRQAGVTPQEDTPVYDNFLDTMHSTPIDQEILDFLANLCFYGDHCKQDERGMELDTPRSVGMRMEVIMKKLLEQRRLHIDRLRIDGDARELHLSNGDALKTLQFTSNDMKTVFNQWKQDVHTWMNPNTIQEYQGTRKWRDVRHNRFSSYTNWLSGCKFMLRSLIALPILASEGSAEQPAVLQLDLLLELTRRWETEKEFKEHQDAIKRSEPEESERASVRLYRVRKRLKEAFTLLCGVEDGELDFDDLKPDKKQMIEDYRAKRGDYLLRNELMAERAANAALYRGAGAVGDSVVGNKPC